MTAGKLAHYLLMCDKDTEVIICNKNDGKLIYAAGMSLNACNDGSYVKIYGKEPFIKKENKV